jgi:hypothetical protein
MGDLAYAYGWTPAVIEGLQADELLRWHGQVRRVHRAMSTVGHATARGSTR